MARHVAVCPSGVRRATSCRTEVDQEPGGYDLLPSAFVRPDLALTRPNPIHMFSRQARSRHPGQIVYFVNYYSTKISEIRYSFFYNSAIIQNGRYSETAIYLPLTTLCHRNLPRDLLTQPSRQQPQARSPGSLGITSLVSRLPHPSAHRRYHRSGV